MKTYSTALFDVGGTLLKFDHAKLARVYTERALTAGVHVAPEHAHALLEALELDIPTMSAQLALSLDPTRAREFWLEFWTEGFRRLGVPADSSRTFAQDLFPRLDSSEFESAYPDAVPALEALKARGVRLGVLSNFSDNCESLLSEIELGSYFDFFIVSAIVGVEKPDPRIFDLAVEAAQRPKHEIVYVGDSVVHDVEGARAAGMDVVLVDRTDRHPEFSGPRVRNLLELLDLIPFVHDR